MLTFESIMSLRRRALNMNFSPNDNRLKSRLQDPWFSYNSKDNNAVVEITFDNSILNI